MGRAGKLTPGTRKPYVWRVAVILPFLFLLLFTDTETLMEKESTRIYKVYCMGDSITYGKGVPEEERAESSYPAVLGKLLGSRYEVVNYGASGRTLLDVPEKSYRATGYLEITKLQQPDIVIVMLGSNDSKRAHWDEAKYKESYLAFVRELQEMENAPEIYIVSPPEAFPGKDGNIIHGIRNDIIHDEIGRIVREVAEETGVHMIDLYAVTEDHPEYFYDGVHPNQEGYAIVAQAIYEQLDKKGS